MTLPVLKPPSEISREAVRTCVASYARPSSVAPSRMALYLVHSATRRLNATEHASTWSRRSVKGASPQVVDRA